MSELKQAWEYSFIHSSATGRGDEEIGPCLTYDKAQAFGKGCIKQREVFVSAQPEANADAKDLEPVEGDRLPQVGSKVLIHLARQDEWVEHTVTGYYAWPDLGGNKSLHRVFVRVVDAEGFDNARLLEDVRAIDAARQAKESK